MDINPNEWLNAVEKIFNRAIGFGIAFGMIAATYYLAFSFKLIEPSDTTKIAYDISQIVLPIAVALVLLGILVWLGRLLLSVAAWPLAKLKSLWLAKERKKRAYQNVCMLTSDARLLLLMYTKHPDGRFRYPGNIAPARDLLEIKAIRSEDVKMLTYDIAHTGEMMIVDPVIMSEDMKKKLRDLVRRDDPKITGDQELTFAVRRMMNRHGLVPA